MSPYALGINFIKSDLMVEQYKFPRSKRKRIKKKWSKRTKNYRSKKEGILINKNTFFYHPVLQPRIRKMIKEN